MNVYTTEDEQIETLKRWLKEYGPTVLTTLFVVLILSFGWRYYQGHKELSRAKASVAYEQLLMNVMNNEKDQAKVRAQYIIKNFSGTPYAKLAGLIMARQDVISDNYKNAQEQLQWVVKHADSQSVKSVARLRLARVLLSQQQASAALKQVDAIKENSYMAAAMAVKGDIYVAKKDDTKARAAYGQALKLLANNDINRPLLEMKYNQLA